MDESVEKMVEKAVEFHGHLCPGLMTGVRVGQIALRELGGRSEDEELVAIVECDNCSVDGVQVLTGCTFGKGNLLYRDHGKNVYTFIRRSDGKAVRIARKPRRREQEPEEYLALQEKVSAGTATADEEALLEEYHRRRSLSILEVPEEEAFTVEEVEVSLPKRAHLRDSVICADCGEPVMETRSRCLGGKAYCLPCFEKYESRW